MPSISEKAKSEKQASYTLPACP